MTVGTRFTESKEGMRLLRKRRTLGGKVLFNRQENIFQFFLRISTTGLLKLEVHENHLGILLKHTL